LTMRVCRAVDRSAADPREASRARLLTPIAKYWICKMAPAFVYEAMECLGGNGYVEDSVLARLYREAPVNAIWEGSGNVICLDVLRALRREGDAARALLEDLMRDASDLPGFDAAAGVVAALLASQAAEGDARTAVETLALIAAAGALKDTNARVAEMFSQARLPERRGLTYGAASVAPESRMWLLDRTLPAS